MEAFSRRNRSSSHTASAAGASSCAVTPARLRGLFAARLNDICARFEEWSVPLTVEGYLGENASDRRSPADPVPLIDPQDRTVIMLEASAALIQWAGVAPGDKVRVLGLLRARLIRGQILPRLEVITLTPCDCVAPEGRDLLAFLRDLPPVSHAFPEQKDISLAVIGTGRSFGHMTELFTRALGGARHSQRVRTVSVDPADPDALSEAIAFAREDVLLLLQGEEGEMASADVLERPEVLQALAMSKAHRILVTGGRASHSLAEWMVDHCCLDAEEAGRYIRRKSGAVFQKQEEERARQEELSALRESLAHLTSLSEAASAGRHALTALLRGACLLVLGGGLGWVLTRFL